MYQYLLLKAIVKKVLPVIAIVALSNNLTAQTKYGIMAGAGKTALYQFPVPPQDNNAYAPQTSWWGGFTANVPLVKNNIHLFATAAYCKKGYKYFLQKDNGATNTIKDSSFKQALNYVDINLNLRKKFMFDEESNNSFFAATGPVMSLLSGGKEQMKANYFGSILPEVSNTNTKLPSGNGPGKYKPVFFSWSFAAGFEINNFSIWINFNLPVTNYYQDAPKGLKHKIKTFGINTAYSLYTHIKREKPEPIIPASAIDTLADNDGDGITNVHDKCPGIKGTAKYKGCPVPDTDGDGINDDDDKCITLAGTIANNGCPAFKDTVKARVAADTVCFLVYFEPGKSILKSEGFNTLSKVVALLKANPKLVATFKGHTDNVGSEAANYSRSLLRASVCADYVASFYIDKERLTVLSLGNKNPAADLNDPLLQWKNRRVEICVFERK